MSCAPSACGGDGSRAHHRPLLSGDDGEEGDASLEEGLVLPGEPGDMEPAALSPASSGGPPKACTCEAPPPSDVIALPWLRMLLGVPTHEPCTTSAADTAQPASATASKAGVASLSELTIYIDKLSQPHHGHIDTLMTIVVPKDLQRPVSFVRLYPKLCPKPSKAH